MTSPPPTLLMIQDNPTDARFMHELLKEAGAESARPLRCEKLNAAYQRLAEEPADSVLLDLFLPDSEGVDTLDRLQAHHHVPIVILTGLNDEAVVCQMVGDRVQGYLKG